MPTEKMRMPTRTAQDRLNELIDWYEKHKPHAGKIIPVTIEDRVLARFAKPIDGKPKHWLYRGRQLHQVEGTPWEV